MKSNNYSAFKFLHQNRSINGGRVKQLKVSIQKLGYLSSRPILINEKSQILDGQHRFIACKELNLPIIYEIHNTFGDDDQVVLELNKNQLIWKLNNYVHLHAEKGLSFYNEVQSLDAKYKLGITLSLDLCCGYKVIPSDIRNGKNLKIWSKRFEIADFILSLKDIPYYRSANFVRSIITLFHKANHKQIMKLKSHMISIPQQALMSQYLSTFSNIINKNVAVDKKITL
jgi:hypothetical protein